MGSIPNSVQSSALLEKWSKKVRENCQSWLKHLLEWIKNGDPDYYASGVRELSATDLADSSKCWHNNTHDLIYRGLNTKIILAYLGKNKQKPNGTLYSFSHLTKLSDAIKFGTYHAGERLPFSFFAETEQFLSSFKKQTAKLKGSGHLDETSADSIPIAL